MKLSIVIVNYNVKYFIEQCLHSVYKALGDIETEVFVVDNNSVDGSCAMIREKFPQVVLIENKKNVGFSKANNQAIRISKGEYVLLLNPDTVVQEDTFVKCIEFMDTHPEAGSLGVKMIDGKGNFLPESKRGLPTPSVAFYKIFGLSRLFPKSKKFGRYHLGFLDNNKTHEIDVLAGAYMFMRRTALDKSGLLDEAFFMYGEDIDLSYRITLAGYKNYYFPETTIIHYKGESTKKGSLNYVLVFYEAMLIFAEKHFSKNNFKLYSLLIRFAIYLRAILSIIKRFVKNVSVPVADAIVVFAGYQFLLPWSESLKFDGDVHYPFYYLFGIVPAYIFIWILSLLFSNAYDKPIKLNNIVRGISIGSVIILAVYALLPLELRFSRLLIVSGAVWAILSLCFYRYILNLLNIKQFKLSNYKKKRILVVGEYEEVKRVTNLLNQTHINPDVVGYISDESSTNPEYLGNISQVEEIILIYQVEEIIFCARNIAAQQIIEHMLKLSAIDIEYKIAPPESLSIIGSNSINTAGELYFINLDTIAKPANRREKRLFDVISAILLLIFWPLLLFIIKQPFAAIVNIINVLIGRKTWVGYQYINESDIADLPVLKKSILSPLDGMIKKNISSELVQKLNILYAKEYKFSNDLNILLKSLLYIGRKK